MPAGGFVPDAWTDGATDHARTQAALARVRATDWYRGYAGQALALRDRQEGGPPVLRARIVRATQLTAVREAAGRVDFEAVAPPEREVLVVNPARADLVDLPAGTPLHVRQLCRLVLEREGCSAYGCRAWVEYGIRHMAYEVVHHDPLTNQTAAALVETGVVVPVTDPDRPLVDTLAAVARRAHARMRDDRAHRVPVACPCCGGHLLSLDHLPFAGEAADPRHFVRPDGTRYRPTDPVRCPDCGWPMDPDLLRRALGAALDAFTQGAGLTPTIRWV